MAIRVTNVTAQFFLNPNVIVRNVTHELEFQQETAKRSLNVFNVTFQALVPASPTIGRSVTQDVEFLDDAFVFHAIADRNVVDDVLLFEQFVVNTGNTQRLEDVLSFSQVARSSIHNENLTQKIQLAHHVSVCLGVKWTGYALIDLLEFGQDWGRLFSREITSTVTFVEELEGTLQEEGEVQTLVFQQLVAVGKGSNPTSTLTFSQSVQTFTDFLKSVEHEDILRHSLTYYFDDPCSKKRYARFVGEGSDSGLEEERLVFNANLVLESLDTETMLVVKNPESDDRDRVGFNRINRETRGGELSVYSDPEWAKVNTMLFTIVALSGGKNGCPDAIGNLMDFIFDNLGKEIYLHDWYGTSWRGVITTPDEVATEDRDGWWTFSFEFQGVEEDGSVPNSTVSFNQSMTFNADWARPLSHQLTFQQEVYVGGDIALSVEQDLGLVQTLEGVQEIDLMFDDMSAGSDSIPLDGESPDLGNDVWHTHVDILDDGTMDDPVDAGAYYPFTPVSGTVYRLEFEEATVSSYNNGDNCIFGFYEGLPTTNLIQGLTADGTLEPTCAKAVHLMRRVSDNPKNGFRRGSDLDGVADTQDWTNEDLRTSISPVLDLAIEIDTRDWSARWYAKETIDADYTLVGQATLLNQEIGSIGWSQDSMDVECAVTSSVRLKELRPI